MNDWNLGPDPAATILSFDVSGGQRPRSAEGPLLEISASGAASARARQPGQPRVTVQLSAKELAALLDTVVTKLGALEIDADAIHAAIAATDKPAMRIADASTTSLTLTLADKHRNISIYALPQQASRHPNIAALQRFHEIARRLREKAAALNAPAK
ncbi:hypothetical protein O4G98_13080 [Zoogloeaceae bacterium G21618-S1]|nr:hypothetical protein [Zoogloeaceae bacterium G21618-S1]